MMKITIALLAVLSGFLLAATYAADRVVHPPTKSCTCGPTCPTPTGKPWPTPASMEKLHGK